MLAHHALGLIKRHMGLNRRILAVSSAIGAAFAGLTLMVGFNKREQSY